MIPLIFRSRFLDFDVFSHPVEGGQSSSNSSLVRWIKREGGRVCREEEHAGFMLLSFRNDVVSQD